MSINNKDIQIYQGETKSLIFEILEKDGTKKNLIGSHITFSLVYNEKIKIIKTETDGIVINNNLATVLLSEEDTSLNSGQFYYELKIKDNDENVAVVSIGNIIILKSITI